MAAQITPLPIPPSREDPVNFSARADAFLGALPTFQSEANVLASEAEADALLAQTKAAEALASANNALASANAAAASFDSFDDRYLGAKSANPTLDNDGQPLLTGALYFNTVASELRIYNGTSWVSAAIVGGTVENLTVNGTFVAPDNSIALGTKTTGNYVADVNQGSGIVVTGADGEGAVYTVAHADTSNQASVNNSGNTVIQDITLDGFGHITGLVSTTIDSVGFATNSENAINATNATNATNSTNSNVTVTAANANYPFVLAPDQVTGQKALLMDNSGGTYNPSNNTATINITGNSATVTNGVYNNGGTYGINITGTAQNSNTLNGFGSDTNASANSIMRRDGNGYSYSVYHNQTSGNNENPSVSQIIVTNGNDNFFRKASLSHVANSIRPTNSNYAGEFIGSAFFSGQYDGQEIKVPLTTIRGNGDSCAGTMFHNISFDNYLLFGSGPYMFRHRPQFPYFLETNLSTNQTFYLFSYAFGGSNNIRWNNITVRVFRLKTNDQAS